MCSTIIPLPDAILRQRPKATMTIPAASVAQVIACNIKLEGSSQFKGAYRGVPE
jgi:hypothetical protein